MKITDLFAPFPDELQLAATPSLSNPPLIEWTSGFGDLFFRIQGAGLQIVWCVLGRGAPAKRPLSRARLATLNKYVSAAYAGRTFFRVVPFSDGDDWALVRPKRALVKSPTQPQGAIWQWSANFPAPNGQIEWLSQSLEWFEKLADRDSRRRFAKSACDSTSKCHRQKLVSSVPRPTSALTLGAFVARSSKTILRNLRRILNERAFEMEHGMDSGSTRAQIATLLATRLAVYFYIWIIGVAKSA